MNIIITNLIYFFISFTVIFLIYILFINKKRKEYSENKNQLEISYLIKRFDLDMRKTKYKSLKIIVSLLNSFILAFTFTLITNINVKYVFKMIIAFFVLTLLIYSLYEIVGRILKKKENKNATK